MAYLHRMYCSYCRSDQDYLNGKCRKCEDRLFREREAIWQSKTSEEKIEELRKRIEQLESSNNKYA